jgi:hypothetical protein
VTAPEELRHRLRELTTRKLVAVAARMRPGKDLDGVGAAAKFALRSVARRYQGLSEEIAELDAQLDHLVAEVAPELISLPAIGTDHAATLLLTMGDNPERLGSEASFASLSAASRPSKPPPVRSCVTASTGAGTGTPIAPCTLSAWCACASTSAPAATSHVEPRRESPGGRS